MKALLDTDTLSLLMRGDDGVTRQASGYLQRESILSFSIITQYEILRGLEYKRAHAQIKRFDQLCKRSEVIPLSDGSIKKAASLYALLKSSGQVIGDADILIAATAIEHGFALVTNNEQHFRRINNLSIQNWKD